MYLFTHQPAHHRLSFSGYIHAAREMRPNADIILGSINIWAVDNLRKPDSERTVNDFTILLFSYSPVRFGETAGRFSVNNNFFKIKIWEGLGGNHLRRIAGSACQTWFPYRSYLRRSIVHVVVGRMCVIFVVSLKAVSPRVWGG